MDTSAVIFVDNFTRKTLDDRSLKKLRLMKLKETLERALKAWNLWNEGKRSLKRIMVNISYDELQRVLEITAEFKAFSSTWETTPNYARSARERTALQKIRRDLLGAWDNIEGSLELADTALEAAQRKKQPTKQNS